MPGFELPDDTATLTFDGRYAGAEAEVKIDVSLKDFMALDTIQEEKGIPAVLEKFGNDILVGWNVTKRGKPVPATGDGMKQLSPVFALTIVQQWREVIAAPPAPLAVQSQNGRMTENSELEESLSLSDFSKPVS